MQCVALVPDLIFQTKIRATAKAIGVELAAACSLDAFREALVNHDPKLVLIDLNAASCAPIDAVTLATQHQPRPQVLAYCSHVQAELQHAATEAGADKVWPRSRFAMELPLVLQGLLDDVQRE